MKVAHNVLYMVKHTQTYVSYPAIDINCMTSRSLVHIDLELEGVHYIEMHRWPHTHWARLLQGANISN